MNRLPEALHILLLEPDKDFKDKFLSMLKDANLSIAKVDCLNSELELENIAKSNPPHIIFTACTPQTYNGALVYQLRISFTRAPIIVLCEKEINIKYDADDGFLKNELTPFLLKKIIEYNLKHSLQYTKLVERVELLSKVTSNIIWDWQLVEKSSVWMGTGIVTSLGYGKPIFKVDSNFWENGLHPEDKERVTSRLSKLLLDNQESSWSDNYRFKTANGAYRHFYDKGHILFEDGKPIRMVGIMEDITLRMELQEKLDLEKMLRQKQITEAVVSAQEKERTDIGRELHDNVNQLLSASKLFIDAAMKDSNQSATFLGQATQYITSAIEEIRALSKVLHTPLIKELGLRESVCNLANDIMIVNNLVIDVDLSEFCEDALSENFKTTLYRIIQEQLTNIIKHAKAANAHIKLVANETSIMLEIMDSGVGFDTGKKRYGVGLSHIQSRARMYDGLMNLQSAPDMGTHLQIYFPLTGAGILV